MKTAKVMIEMGRAGAAHAEGDTFMITITDEASGIPLVHVSLGLGEALAGITGRVLSHVDAEYGALDLVGRAIAIEEVEVDMRGIADTHQAKGMQRLRERVDLAVAELEARRPGYGWAPRYNDAKNSHHRVRADVYRVTMTGYEPRVANDAAAKAES